MLQLINRLRTRLDQASYYVVLLAAFSLPFSTAITNLLFGLTVLLIVIGNNWPNKWRIIKTNPLTPWVIMLFVVYVIGISYSLGSWHNRFHELGKYHKLLLIPLLMPLFVTKKWRVRVVAAFLLAMLITLVLSYLQYFDLITINKHFGQASIFKNHSTINLLMAISFYMVLQAAFEYKHYFWWFIMYALLALGFVCFLNGGRIGYLVFAALLCLFGYQRWQWRGALVAVIALVALFSTAFLLPTSFSVRVHNSINGITHQTNRPTATTIRQQEAKTTWKMIQAHPVFGTGTGSYAVIYHEFSPRQDYSDNAQIQYLQILAELGIFGLLFFLLYLWRQWRLARCIEQPWGQLAIALVIAQVLASMSLLILSDTTESHFFALFIALCFACLSKENADA